MVDYLICTDVKLALTPLRDQELHLIKKGICNACQWAYEKKQLTGLKDKKLLGNYFKKNKKKKLRLHNTC